MIRRRLFYRLGLALGMLLFGYQVWRALKAIWQNPSIIVSPWHLIGAVLIDIVAYFCLILAWLILMHLVDVRLPLWSTGRGYILSFLPRYIPGTVWGYLSRSEWLAQTAGVSFRQSGFASTAEIGLQVFTSVLCAMLLVASPILQISILIASGVGAVFIVRFWANLYTRLLRQQTPAVGHVAFSWGYLLIAFVAYTVFWLLQGLATWLIAISVSQSTSLTIPLATSVFAGSWLVGFLTIVIPSGLGVREWTMSYLLIENANLTAEEAASVSILARLAIIVAELLLLAWATRHSAFAIWGRQR